MDDQVGMVRTFGFMATQVAFPPRPVRYPGTPRIDVCSTPLTSRGANIPGFNEGDRLFPRVLVREGLDDCRYGNFALGRKARRAWQIPCRHAHVSRRRVAWSGRRLRFGRPGADTRIYAPWSMATKSVVDNGACFPGSVGYASSSHFSLSSSIASMGEGIWLGSMAARRPLYGVPALCGGCGIWALGLCAYMKHRRRSIQDVEREVGDPQVTVLVVSHSERGVRHSERGFPY